MTTDDIDLKMEIIDRKLDHLGNALLRLSQQLTDATVIPAPEWCSAPEAARRLGVTPSTIRRKAARGEIAARGAGATRQFRVLP